MEIFIKQTIASGLQLFQRKWCNYSLQYVQIELPPLENSVGIKISIKITEEEIEGFQANKNEKNHLWRRKKEKELSREFR